MLLSGRNDIKLGDLGISKLMDSTHASTHAGTPVYMSPEVFEAQFMDTNYYPNADVWYETFCIVTIKKQLISEYFLGHLVVCFMS